MKVKLISSDGIYFEIDKHLAIQSKTLNLFFNTHPAFIEQGNQSVMLPIKSKYLRRVIEYLEYKITSQDKKSFEEFKVSDEETVDLLDAAAYLRL
ncbi:SKP1 component [Nosema bombycis CQ1]|jgi:hypothetical protein|uniref:Elongin-C n=1 Tax=Nosema bombycis (strain CQ1 / CVCC 102059) TaxID=578461 RepID=R0MDR1_NOSB1|nr:SKP1 component [Nosema bombycis CQ1]|eukprot:EOB12220.1 SKP1 component [Nosema bombycis CQ1]